MRLAGFGRAVPGDRRSACSPSPASASSRIASGTGSRWASSLLAGVGKDEPGTTSRQTPLFFISAPSTSKVVLKRPPTRRSISQLVSRHAASARRNAGYALAGSSIPRSATGGGQGPLELQGQSLIEIHSLHPSSVGRHNRRAGSGGLPRSCAAAEPILNWGEGLGRQRAGPDPALPTDVTRPAASSLCRCLRNEGSAMACSSASRHRGRCGRNRHGSPGALGSPSAVKSGSSWESCLAMRLRHATSPQRSRESLANQISNAKTRNGPVAG